MDSEARNDIIVRIRLSEHTDIELAVDEERLQKTLQADLKQLAYEWMQQFKAPMPSPEKWDAARIEFVSRESIEREAQLRNTLEWIRHHPDINDSIYARIQEVLQPPDIPF